MKTLAPLASVLLSLSAFARGAAFPTYLQQFQQSRPHLSTTQVRQELGSRVSNGTLIFGPENSQFHNATSRWSEFAAPQVQVVVVPATEKDVVTTVIYCNQNSIQFLTVNRGHGWTSSLGAFNGIQIDMQNLNTIDIHPDGKSAWFGGGAYDGEASRYLWEEGYVATTGACDCVGMMGPGLGGGYGRHGGIYGLISDNLITLNVVLANGDAITVNSTSHADLLWAMKGAGHNFGIATSFHLKIHPRGPDTWHYHNYIWRGAQLEAVFEALNAFARSSPTNSTPVNMTTNQGSFEMNTTITTEEPVIWWTFQYRGSAEEAETLLAPFNAIENAYEEFDDVPYPTIAVAAQSAESSVNCQHGATRVTGTTFLQAYNITIERQIFDRFQKRLEENPSLVAGASITHEGYSNEGVRAFPSAGSAFPWRADVHLTLVDIVVDPSNQTLQADAWHWTNEILADWHAGQPDTPPHTYINYANGFESSPSVYGYEPWRLEKLRHLKQIYDPTNAFAYYNPIVRPNHTEASTGGS